MNKQDPIVLVIDFHHARYVLPAVMIYLVTANSGLACINFAEWDICWPHLQGPGNRALHRQRGYKPRNRQWLVIAAIYGPVWWCSPVWHCPWPSLTWPFCLLNCSVFEVQELCTNISWLVTVLVRPRNSPILLSAADKHPIPPRHHCLALLARDNSIPSSFWIDRLMWRDLRYKKRWLLSQIARREWASCVRSSPW